MLIHIPCYAGLSLQPSWKGSGWLLGHRALNDNTSAKRKKKLSEFNSYLFQNVVHLLSDVMGVLVCRREVRLVLFTRRWVLHWTLKRLSSIWSFLYTQRWSVSVLPWVCADKLIIETYTSIGTLVDKHHVSWSVECLLQVLTDWSR